MEETKNNIKAENTSALFPYVADMYEKWIVNKNIMTRNGSNQHHRTSSGSFSCLIYQ